MALYKGYGASVLASSHVAVQFPVFEAIKEAMLGVHMEAGGAGGGERAMDRELYAYEIIIASAVSKTIASCFTYPSEVIRARLQVRMALAGVHRRWRTGVHAGVCMLAS